jgi:hypothetical protein
MAKHRLSLECPDTLNGCILRLADSSSYNVDSPVTCVRLLITTPGFTTPIEIPNPQPGFMYNFTACDLGLQKERCGTDYFDLPDGIYILKYSVSPNEYVYVEYNHLRITKALNIIQSIYCDLDLGACEPSDKVDEKFEELREIESILKAAKAKVEFCLEPKKGMELFAYALRLLDKLRCRTTSCRR